MSENTTFPVVDWSVTEPQVFETGAQQRDADRVRTEAKRRGLVAYVTAFTRQNKVMVQLREAA